MALNRTQGTHCFPHAHIYVSLVYLVPHHHLLIHLLHVHLRLCSRVLLCGKRKKKIDRSGFIFSARQSLTNRKFPSQTCVRIKMNLNYEKTTFSIYMPFNAPCFHFCQSSVSKAEPKCTLRWHATLNFQGQQTWNSS